MSCSRSPRPCSPISASGRSFTTGDGSERAHELIAACGCASLGKPFDLRDLLDLTRQLTLRVHDARA